MSFAEKIKHNFDLSDKSINTLLENMEEISYSKGDIIVYEGQRNDYIYFVESGIVHCYVLRDGKHRAILFAFEGNALILTSSFSGDKMSRQTLEASTDTKLLRITQRKIEELYSESVELANWGRRLAEKVLYDYEKYFTDYFWADKGTQYFTMIKEYPQLLQKISLKELASYLNITPQSLSRIRAQKKSD